MIPIPRLLPLLALAVSLAVSGCANAPFYNEARDKQGQALGQAVAQVDLMSMVDELDKKFAALRQLEADTMRARQLTNRDLEIAHVASAGAAGDGTINSRYVDPFLDRRLERLVGKKLTIDEMDRVLEQSAENDERDRQAASALRTFSAMSRLTLQSCVAAERIANDKGELDQTSLDKIPPAKRGSSLILFREMLSQCRRKVDAFASLVAETSVLHSLKKTRDDAEKEVNDYRKALETEQKKLAEQVRIYEAEVKAIQPKADDAGYRAELSAAAERLKAGIGAIRDVAKPGGAFEDAEAQAKLEALESLLGAIASGVSDPAKLSADQRQAVALVRLIPSVADEADKLLKDAERPRLGPLLLAKEQQRLAVEGFAARLTLLQRRATIRQQQLEAARSEVIALSRARRALGPPKTGQGVTVDLSQPLDKALADQEISAGRRRVALYESLALYFDHAQMYRARQESLDLAAIGVTDDIVMQQSRSAARMWHSLMSNMASILADYHAAGIKPADLAEFLKGLGIVYIGHGAGK